MHETGKFGWGEHYSSDEQCGCYASSDYTVQAALVRGKELAALIVAVVAVYRDGCRDSF